MPDPSWSPTRRRFVVALLLSLVVGFVACSPKKKAATGGGSGSAGASFVDLSTLPFHEEWVGGEFILARASLPKRLNGPWSLARGDAAWLTKQFTHPTLLIEHPDPKDGGAVMPWAAEALPSFADDHLSCTFRLREGLAFEDGTAVTAKHFADTWEIMNDPECLASSLLSNVERVASVEAVDSRTLRARFKAPYYRAAEALGLSLCALPTHNPPAARAEWKEATTHPGYGAYRVVSLDGEALRLELLPRYRKAAHPIRPFYIETFRIVRIAEASKQEAMARAGQVDFAFASAGRMKPLLADSSLREKAEVGCYSLASYFFIAWNQRTPGGGEAAHPVLCDLRVRKALAHLFPRERVIERHFGGLADLCDGPFDARDPGVDPEVKGLSFDPKEASRLLEEAGWSLDESGHRSKDGQRLKIGVLYPAIALYEPLFTSFQESCRGAGVTIEALGTDGGSFGQKWASGAFDGLIAIWRTEIDADLYGQFHGGAGPGGNPIHFQDAELDRLIEAARAEMDPEKRTKLRRQCFRRVHELQPYAFLFQPPNVYVMNKRWANAKPHAMGIRFWDLVLRKRFKP